MSFKEEILKYSRQDRIAPLSDWFDNALSELIDFDVYPYSDKLDEIGKILVKNLVAYREKYNVNDVVIGMSGGVDSALTAALFKRAGYTVWGFTLPIHQKPEETERGMAACRAFDIIHKQIDLTESYEFMLKQTRLFDPEIDNEEAKLRRGNLRVRLRMMTLYNMASAVRGFVASTDNYSELAAGFWTLHGDVGDVSPIQSLNKSWEVPKLAEIAGVPQETVFATPTDGLGISNGDEDQFGFSYLEFDIVLHRIGQTTITSSNRQEILESLAVPDEDLEKVNRILDRIQSSAFKRANPFNLLHPAQPTRFQQLETIDTAVWNPVK
jgi:nicotinamide-nucleotide amidase